MNDKLSILINNVLHHLPFSTPFIFIYLTALITAVTLKQKLRLTDRLVTALVGMLVVEIMFPFIHVYVVEYLLHTSGYPRTNLAYAMMAVGLTRTITTSALLAVVLYDLVITRFDLLPVQKDQHPKIKRTIQLTFHGGAFGALKYVALLLISGITIIPMAWTVASLNRWLVSSVSHGEGKNNTSFQGTGNQIKNNTSFQGTGNQIWPCFVGISLIAAGSYALTIFIGFISGDMEKGKFYFMSLYPVLLVCLLPLTIFLSFKIVKWSVNSITTEGGVNPVFEGKYTSLVGYNLLLVVMSLTVIGWAWVYASLLNWLCENVRINGYRVRFVGRGHQVLGVYLVYLIGCFFIVTIPLATAWFYKWHIENIEIDELEQSLTAS